MLVTNIDDFLSDGSDCSDKNMHTPYKTSSNEPESCRPSQHTINLSETTNLQVPIKASPLDFPILDPENEKGLIVPVETIHANQQKENSSGSKSESPDTGYKSMYPLGYDSDSNSDSTTDSSAVVYTNAGSGCLHELFSDEEEVEFCSFDTQQCDAAGHSHMSHIRHFQDASSKNTNQDKTISEVSLAKTENSAIMSHSLQQSQLLGVLSTEKKDQLSSAECHINTAFDTCGKDKTCVTFSPEEPKTYSSPSPQDTNIVTQGSIANLHADISLTLDSFKHLNTDKLHSPSMELKTSGLNIDRLDTGESTSMITKEKVLDYRTYLSPHASFLLKKTSELKTTNCPMWRNTFKLQAETESSTPKLKGLSIKSKNKPQNDILQSQSESLVSPNKNTSLNQSKALPQTENCILKTSTQSDMNKNLALPKVSDLRQGTAEHGHSDSTMQTAQPDKDKDSEKEPLGSKATAKSLHGLHPSATRKTFIEVKLSCLSRTSPLVAYNEPINSRDHKPTYNGTDTDLTPMNYPFSVEKSNVVVSNTLCSSLCYTKETHSAVSNSLKPSTIVETRQTLKSNISRMYIKTTERGSFSTNIALSANSNHFSVRHKIKSFENLANLEKNVIKNSDIQSYPLASRISLNQRIAGYMDLVNSTDCEARQNSLSPYMENLIPTTPCSTFLGKSPSSFAVINLELPHSSCNTTSPTEDHSESGIKEVPEGAASKTSSVLSKKHRKLPCKKMRQLRALSMPELEKICKGGYVGGHGADTIECEAVIHPTTLNKVTGTETLLSSANMERVNLNKARKGYPKSTEVTPQATAETHGHQPGWSIRWEYQIHICSF